MVEFEGIGVHESRSASFEKGEFCMFCQQCGSPAITGARFCSSCGASLEQNTSTERPALRGEQVPRPESREAHRQGVPGYLWAAVAALAVIVIFALFLSSNNTSNAGPTTGGDYAGAGSASTSPTDAPSGPKLPAAEATLLASKDAVEARFADAPNDMVKHQIAGKWQNGGSCPKVQSAQFTDWVGTIKTIQYDGTFEVDLSDGVLFHGSIDSDSPLFKEVSALHEGDAVMVSGNFSTDQFGSECTAQATSDWVANSDEGSVKSPIFHVLYSHVKGMGASSP